ncbi:MAG: sigma-70 family RNA polymerase sigma factor [Clostridia bacterium]|nr:sigma-70 family RNA polymerase sigma factor [Clostridia bacterium]
MSHKVVITGVSTDDLPKYSTKEIEELLRKIKNGENRLRNKFIEGNLRLVLSMVQRFKTDKVSADDLFQVGILGLIKALDNFNVSLNVRFSTYAVPMILGEMKRYIRESCALKVGRGIRDIAFKAMTAREKLERCATKEVTLEEIASEIAVPYKDVVGALDAISDPVSIYEAVYNDGEESTLVVDKISDTETEDEKFNKLTLRQEIDKLPDREKNVIRMRYFQGKTQTEISEELNISQAQVSRLENSAIKQLKAAF